MTLNEINEVIHQLMDSVMFSFPCFGDVVQLQAHPVNAQKTIFHSRTTAQHIKESGYDCNRIRLKKAQCAMIPANRAFALAMVALDDEIERIRQERAPGFHDRKLQEDTEEIHEWIYGSHRMVGNLTPAQIQQARYERLALLDASKKNVGLPAIGPMIGQEAISAETVNFFVRNHIQDVGVDQLVAEQLTSFCLPLKDVKQLEESSAAAAPTASSSTSALKMQMMCQLLTGDSVSAAAVDKKPIPLMNFFTSPIFEKQLIRELKGFLKDDKDESSKLQAADQKQDKAKL